MINVGTNVLVTTQNWFIAPDGKQYKAVFGTVNGIHSDEDTLGIKTNRASTNWYVVVGSMTIAGCQIYYSIETDNCNFDYVQDYSTSADKGCVEYQSPSRIFNANL